MASAQRSEWLLATLARLWPTNPSSGAALSVAYCIWLVTFAASLAWIMPAWQNPDEGDHFERAAQVALGEWVGRRADLAAGGLTYPGINLSVAPLLYVNPDASSKMTRRSQEAAEAVPWGNPGLMYFPVTAQYPPALYAPAATVIAIGHASDVGLVTTLRVVRLVNSLFVGASGAMAIAFAQRTRLAIATTLMLPMTVSLAASPSQDSLLIPLAALAVALVDRARANPPPSSAAAWRTLIATALCLLAVATAKPPYLLGAVQLIVLLPAAHLGRWRAWTGVMLFVLTVAWAGYVATRINIPMSGSDPTAQVLRLVHHPWRLVLLLGATWGRDTSFYIESMIGRLGWLNAVLPEWFRALCATTLVLGLLSAGTRPAREPRWPPRILASVAAVGSGLLLFVALYVTWTPLARPIVEGMQGRYFLPLLPLLALGLPNLGALGRAARPCGFAALVLVGLVEPTVVLVALVDRYYLVP